ncbi:MAG TPA: MBL fold metallo-hydrolase [Spirochaetota bacterium]|nr:MBL fold metallo-hydrolase [Spirochaetota bacterium]HOD13639.1 MBL fold metallo-hydrolase [Spirochaetota bacterium]HPG52262.1 MBL fold metallo-hydrolase [Spirochaetota bacterium]HPN11661.1 MBL fold metallo-hydrolase [Spirochaetota bacterium]HQL82808.1 MBL fold metallo-hydrolase [Spirochaetota bacterium]
MKKKLIIAGSIVAGLLLAGVLYVWYQYSQFQKVEIIRVDPLLTVYKGGGNSIALTTKDGATALIVDTKMGGAAEVQRNDIKADTITIVNTHDHSDHAGGNALYPKATVIAGAYGKEQWDKDSSGAAYPARTLQPGEEMVIPVGDETAVIRNMGRGHTQNDTVVFLKKRGLLVTGDLVFLGQHPALIERSGTNIASWITHLDDLYARFDAKSLVPGHGPVSDRKAILDMKEYFTSIRDAVASPEKLDALREKYKNYRGMPIMMNFNATVSYIKKEMERK